MCATLIDGNVTLGDLILHILIDVLAHCQVALFLYPLSAVKPVQLRVRYAVAVGCCQSKQDPQSNRGQHWK